MSLLALAVATAVVAAVRSTWSPCGLSMLSTLTPLSERARGRRWGWTAGWYLAGAVFGGAGLGVLAAAGATAVGAVGPPSVAVWSAVAVLALAGFAADRGLVAPIPHHRRQVNEHWLDQFRSWFYGFGFGAQIGFGLATYIMTTGVYLTILLGAATGHPVQAFAVGVLFGTVRGAAVGLSAGLDRPERVRALHARLDAWSDRSRWLAAAWLAVVAVVAGLAVGVAGGLAAAVAAGTVSVLARRLRRAGTNVPVAGQPAADVRVAAGS
jgi:hypothetical protein